MPVAVAGHVHHFAMGSWLPLLANLVSVTGSVVGLACTLRARRAGDDGRPRYRWPVLAAVSIGIAVMAATATLWFTVLIERPGTRVPAGLVMGLAVSGMHYTGMAAVRVHLDPPAPVRSRSCSRVRGVDHRVVGATRRRADACQVAGDEELPEPAMG